MNLNVSDNTKSILLLTAPLIVGKVSASVAVELLKPAEYKRFAIALRANQHQPADLISVNAAQVIKHYDDLFSVERLNQLLSRGFLLAQALELWASRGIYPISRADSIYPKRLKQQLGEDAPSILYACGNINLADMGGLAVVGSRNISPELMLYSEKIGKLAAKFEKIIISGGAKGVDLSAMQATLMQHGYCIGFLSNGLLKESVNRTFRTALMNQQLLLLSHVDPSAGFHVGIAMQRNKYIYALSDAALVINADFEKGGTWEGAKEQLNKYHFVPVYIRSVGEQSKGLDGLKAIGAQNWAEPQTSEAFNSKLCKQQSQSMHSKHEYVNGDLFSHLAIHELEIENTPKMITNSETTEPALPMTVPNQEVITPAEQLFLAVKNLIAEQLESAPKKEKELAELLNISTTQLKKWLSRLEADRLIEKHKTAYRLATNTVTL